ncbi:hypothetical protein [Nocardia anaemiae]|uniref:hypothetical protein n=1 Tax=Nocardia anaemiae TaxID=263910 RepID=UPI0007A4391A|nr:hypothetical protein [Nocardia anaemiae]
MVVIHAGFDRHITTLGELPGADNAACNLEAALEAVRIHQCAYAFREQRIHFAGTDARCRLTIPSTVRRRQLTREDIGSRDVVTIWMIDASEYA